jgi:glycosyltransferase involved in cell wall biosynthesis
MIFKKISLNLYRIYLFLIVNINSLKSLWFSRRTTSIKVFYGGARTGNLGGPLVKVFRLNQLFPESKFNFNLLYCLSNTPYLSQYSLEKIKGRNIPIILNQNGVFYKGWYPNGWKEKNSQMSHTYHIADYVFWQSEFSRSTANIFLGERKGRGEILYNAVDLNLFKPRSNNMRLPSKINFLIVGKFNSDKFYAIEPAMIALKDNLAKGYNFNLIIAGYMDSKLKSKTLEIAEKLGVESSIKLIGEYNQIDAPAIYRRAQILIHLKYLDPCPNVVIEGMASGLPVIYSDSGGTPELVSGIAGIPVESIVDFEQPPIAVAPSIISLAMIKILDDYAVRSNISRGIAEKNFDLNAWHQQHAKIFEYYLSAIK